MIGQEIPLTSRIFTATYTLVLNAVLWILIPAFISSEISSEFASIPLSNLGFIYAFGGIITGLHVLSALTNGKAFSAVFASGSYIATAFYVWLAVNGGQLAVTTGSAGNAVTVTLIFKTALFLLILPSLVGAIRPPLEFLLDRSEAGQAARDLP